MRALLHFSIIFCAISYCTTSLADIGAAFTELKKQVIERSPEIRSAEALADQKSAQLYTSWTRWMPRIDLQLSQSRSQDFSIVSSGALGSAGGSSLLAGFSPSEVTLSRWSLNLTAPLYRREVHLGLQQSYTEKEIYSQQFQIKQTEMDWRLRSLLGTYLFQAYKIAILKASAEIAQTNLREATLRFKLGERTRIDVLRAEANLESINSKSLTHELDKTSALSALLEYSGLKRDELKTIGVEALLTNEETIARSIDAFTQIDPLIKELEPYFDTSALQNRISESSPLYRTYLLEQDLSDIRSRSLTAEQWPELGLQGSLNKQAPDWSTALESANRSHSIALVLSIPIFTAGASISSYLEKKNAQTVNLVKREQDVLKLRDELESELIQIQVLRKTLQSQKLNLSENEELVRLSTKSYQLGKTTLLELLTSQNDLLESKQALAQTKINTSVLLRKYAWNLGVRLP